MINRVTKIQSFHSVHWWDLTRDGLFSTPRIKGKDKQHMRRSRRVYEKAMAKTEAGD